MGKKTEIMGEIIDVVRTIGGRFIKKEDGCWYDVGDTAAREKIGHVFRELLHTKYRSSNKSKLARRKAGKAFSLNRLGFKSSHSSTPFSAWIDFQLGNDSDSDETFDWSFEAPSNSHSSACFSA